MSRRVRVPGADELFHAGELSDGGGPARLRSVDTAAAPAPRRSSRRERHEEKITIYLSSAELIAMEQARLTLRADHQLRVDRGRLVRAAVAAALADLDERGPQSTLVHRLHQD